MRPLISIYYMHLHMDFRDSKKKKKKEIFNLDFFFAQKIFDINQKNYESDKGIFCQF